MVLPTTIKNSSPYYRPDIDGLRAVALLLVIGFHFFPNLFPCGFLGVDVFFVISGFVITELLLRELKSDRFSFKQFYSRRIKRLFPTMLFIFSLFLIYGWFVLLPSEFKQMGGNIFSGSLSFANIFLYKETGYFDAASDLKPFLHLWSLSVEEQFYLGFPLFLFVAFKFEFLKKKLPVLIFLIGIISFYLSAKGFRNNEFTFYSPFTRCWELLLGCGLSFIHKEKLTSCTKVKNVLSLSGIALILLSVFYLDPQKLYPGWRALMPTVGAVLILFSGQESFLNKKILSSAPLVFIGLISYTWYLMHWPFISISRLIDKDLSNLWQFKIFIIMLTFVLSILLYYFWESKIRYSKKNYTKHLLIWLCSVTLISGLIYFEKIKTYAAYNVENLEKVSTAIQEWDYPDKKLIPFSYKDRTFYKIGNAKEKVLFFGDSNIEQYVPRISLLMSQNPENFKEAYFSTRGGSPPLPDIFDDKHPSLVGFIDTVLDLMNDKKDITDIVICASWTSYLGGESPYYYEKNGVKYSLSNESGLEKAYDSFEDMVSKFVRNGKKVHIVLSMPSGTEYCPKHFIERSFLGSWHVNIQNACAQDWRQKSQKVMQKLRAIANRHNINIIDPTDFLCDNDKCITEINGHPIYKDGGHLRPTYVRKHVEFLDDIIKK